MCVNQKGANVNIFGDTIITTVQKTQIIHFNHFEDPKTDEYITHHLYGGIQNENKSQCRQISNETARHRNGEKIMFCMAPIRVCELVRFLAVSLGTDNIFCILVLFCVCCSIFYLTLTCTNT